MGKLELVPVDHLRDHERTLPRGLAQVVMEVVCDGRLFRPVLVDEGTLTIIDGHHRTNAFRLLGLKHIPAYLVDYWEEVVLLEGATKQEVIDRATRGDPFPPKSTRHVLKQCCVPLVNADVMELGLRADSFCSNQKARELLGETAHNTLCSLLRERESARAQKT